MKDQIKKENILNILNGLHLKKTENNQFFGRVKEINFLEKIYSNTKISGESISNKVCLFLSKKSIFSHKPSNL